MVIASRGFAHPPSARFGSRVLGAAILAAATTLAACGGGPEPPLPGPRLKPTHGAGPNTGNVLFASAGPLEGVALQEVASLPSVPIYFTAPARAPQGDDRLFIVQRNGAIRILSQGKVLAEPFLDISDRVTEEGEGGLLSMAFHPRYDENGFFFVNYTDPEGDTVVARYRRSPTDPDRADPASAVRLLWIDQPYSNHNGGQLQFGPDGYLYVGMGDGGSAGDPSCFAQRRVNLLGKMLRIDVDRSTGGRPYAIPPDNPYLGDDRLPDEAWAIGLRNPWRFSFDRQTGDLWIGDVGQNRREEIDRIPAGGGAGTNFGWKPMEGTLCFSDDACEADTPACGSPNLTLPALEYGHDDGDCSVTGGYVYRGRKIPALAGRYLFGDYCSGRVWAAKPGPAGYEVRQLPERAWSVVSFGEDRDGEIWLGTFEGRVYRLVLKNR